MNKKLLSLFLSLMLVLSLALPVSAAEKTVTLKVGEEKTVDVSKYIANVHGLSFEYVDGVQKSPAICTPKGSKVKVHGLYAGEMNAVAESFTGETVALKIKVTGKAAKHKKYNKMSSVIARAHECENIHFEQYFPDAWIFNADTATSQVRIAFYNKDKKKVGVGTFGRNLGAIVVNPSFEITAQDLGVSSKNFKSIKYFRILEVK